MHRNNPLPLLILSVLFATSSLMAQQPQAPKVNSTGGTSPHETTSAIIDGNRVTVTYGRPYSKDPRSGQIRKVWGALVPWDKAWRLGSDEATLLLTQQPLQIGDTTIPAGAYTLYMVPSESGASKLAFSKTLGGWGIPVDEKNDLARVDVKKDPPLESSVDQFTLAVVRNPAGGGMLTWKWENTQYSVPFTVKK